MALRRSRVRIPLGPLHIDAVLPSNSCLRLETNSKDHAQRGLFDSSFRKIGSDLIPKCNQQLSCIVDKSDEREESMITLLSLSIGRHI